MISLKQVSLRTIQSNGLSMRIAEADATGGKGPAVLLLHGWHESWYSWRRQITALADAGYRVIAPDMPGFGGTDSLPRMEDYAARSALCDRFFYQLYVQKPGIAEAELDADPAGLLRRLYCSPDTKRYEPKVTDKQEDAGGWIDRMGEPMESPAWFTVDDLYYYVGEFSRKGFTGDINYYRNIDRNWELMAPYANRIIEIPALFMAGDQDFVIGRATREQLIASMIKHIPKLKDVVILPGIGHWIQQEASDQVNKAILGFLQETESSF